MVGFDDAAQMGLAAINAGVQIYGQRVQNRLNKKLQGIQYGQALRHHEDDLTKNRLSQEDLNRQAGYTQNDMRQAIGDQQGPESSYGNYMYRRTEGERSRRMAALEAEEKMSKADWLDYKRMLDIQKKMQKSAQTMGMISSLLLQGGSGAGAMMG